MPTDPRIAIIRQTLVAYSEWDAGDLHTEKAVAVLAAIDAVAREHESGREIQTAEQLDQILSDMNFERGINPVVVGFDAHDAPFLAYGWAPGGDGWDAGFVADDTHSAEFDYSDGTKRCEECGAFDRRTIEKLRYPLRVLRVSAGTSAELEGGQR